MQPTIITLPPRWVNASVLEDSIRQGSSPLSSQSSEIVFQVPRKCNLMTDAAIRLLSFLNQLDFTTRRVVLKFDAGGNGVLPYLDRIGFFQCLAPNIVVLPHRPA